MSSVRFADLDLSAPMLSALEAIGYLQPTPVQATAIPLIGAGRDLMVQSQTGTGKTAAFGIPLIERLGAQPARGIQALVLAPTRELAKQVSDELNRLAAHHGVQSVAIYGGASMDKQIAEIKFAHIVAGTPGRVLDHLRRGTLRFNGLRMVVLDEADEMLSLGFARELEQVMSFVPAERQTLLFSATIPEDIKSYAQRYMRQPEFVSLIEQNVGADDVEHHYYMVSGVGRSKDLVQVIEFEEPGNAIIFTNTRADSEVVAQFLKRQGYEAEYLNGDLPQRDREAIMARTKDKSLRFLVATDIAARGIDISQLSHVINFTLPESPEVYIHRTGRTGRAGHKGTAISLIGPREIGVYYYLKRIYKVALQERSVPTQAEIDLRKAERRTDAIVEEIFALHHGRPPHSAELRAQAVRLLERDDAIEVMEALLALFHQRAQRTIAGTASGGPLAAVPRPDVVPPGSRADTLATVAERVAIVQSEFRGLPPDRDPGPRRVPPRDERPVAPPVRAEVAASASTVPDAGRSSAPRPDAPPARPARSNAPDGDASPRRLPPLPAGQARLWVNVGERDDFDGPQLAVALADLAGLDADDVLDVDLRLRHSYVVVLGEYARDVVDALDGERLDGKKLRVELAKDEA
jgi:ATP-dependent RNA helicase DeaD